MKYSFLKIFSAFLLITFLVISCVDNEFDEPPVGGSDPGITAGDIVSLSAVFDKYVQGEFIKLDIDKYVQAVVVADDESGNFFRQIIIEDENSDLGINLLIDDVELYNTYPVGRRVFVHLKDLYVGDYNGLPQLGGAPYDDDGDLRLAGIQSELAKNEIVLPGVFGLEVIPRLKSMADLTEADLNTLVMLENVQFSPGSAGVTYAIADPPEAVNHSLMDCNGNEIILRTSGYCDFAGSITPDLNGSLTAVYGVFGDDQQLLVRELNDVAFTEPRCETPTIALSTIRANYLNGSSMAPNGMVVGTVTSDYTTDNVNSRNLYLQDETAGILIRFTGNHSFTQGSQLMVDVSGQELSEFRGLLQINNVPRENAQVIGQPGLPNPEEVDIATILSDFENYESEYVLVKGASISGGNTFSGGLDINDGTGTIEMFTQFGATFAGDAVPSGQVDIMAIVSIYDDPQLVINNSTDVTGGGSSGGGDLVDILALRNAFENGSSSAPQGFIQGVVISDRINGNTNSRNLVLQDGTAGIVVRFTSDHDFDLGEEVKVTVSSQELSEFRGLLQVNNVSLGNATLLGPGVLPQPVSLDVAELSSNIEVYESRLVRLSEVTLSGTGTYDGSVDVTDATGTISMFTNSAASFAGSALPTEPVTVTAIASQFNDAQIIIRNLSDVSSGGAGGDDLTIISLRNAFAGGATSAPSGTIRGVVISDYVNENTTSRNLHIQDESGGITIRFQDSHTYALGTALSIDVSGLELSEFRGLLQVNDVPNNNATDLGSGTLPDPKVLTIQEINSDFENLESTLVRINDVTFGSGSWTGTITLNDNTGSILSFTRSQASFAGSATPAGQVDIIGIITQFDDAQITIRNLSDIIQ